MNRRNALRLVSRSYTIVTALLLVFVIFNFHSQNYLDRQAVRQTSDGPACLRQIFDFHNLRLIFSDCYTFRSLLTRLSSKEIVSLWKLNSITPIYLFSSHHFANSAKTRNYQKLQWSTVLFCKHNHRYDTFVCMNNKFILKSGTIHVIEIYRI